MSKRVTAFFIIAAIIFFSMPSHAIEFHSIGFIPTSMGGAGVATARGSLAPYYNPALLPENKNGMEVSVSGSMGYREINVVDHIDTLADIDIENTLDEIVSSATRADPNNIFADLINWAEKSEYKAGLSNTTVPDDLKLIKRELRALSQQNGLQVMPNASFGTQFGNFAIGVYGISEATAYAVIDPDRLGLIVDIDPNNKSNLVELTGKYIGYDPDTDLLEKVTKTEYDQTSMEYALNNHTTYLKLTGIAYGEIPIAYGRSFSTDKGKLNLGGSFKIMQGYTFDQVIDIDTESEEVRDELEDLNNKSTAYGVDLGLFYQPPKLSTLSNLSVGLVAKNINTPKFDLSGGGTIDLKPQYRVGFAYNFWHNKITMALDVDLTNNQTNISNYNAQFIGGGFNFHPYSWLSLRLGAMQNIQESAEGMISTGGLSLGVKWLQLDLAGQLSNKKGELDGQAIPRYGKVQVALVSKWF